MVTIVSDTKRFVFVHIPKCAGASITKMLEPLVGWEQLTADAEAGRRGETGRIIREHAPLEIVRARYPEELDRFERYAAYAVTREPMERFVSAVSQHLRSFHGREIFDLSPAELSEVIDGVIAQMTRTPLHVPDDLIHFTRQVDYIRLDGRQVIGNLYRMETLGTLVTDLSQRHDMALELSANKNETSAYRSAGLKKTMRLGGAAARRLLPQAAYRTVRKWARGKATIRARDHRPVIFESRKVQNFVSDFYAEDRALWESTAPGVSSISDSGAGRLLS